MSLAFRISYRVVDHKTFVAQQATPPPTVGADQEWLSFWGTVPAATQATANLLYTHPIVLANDSLRAYHAGAVGAAAITCRATVESACFIALTSVRSQSPAWLFTYPLNLVGKFRRVHFEEILRAVEDRRLLPGNLVADARRIQTDGDFIAHIASKQADMLLRIARSPSKGVQDWMRLWLSPQEVWDDIQSALSILRVLFQWSHDQPQNPP
jgi:hypothetical protein